jgi:hypothetical protein
LGVALFTAAGAGIAELLGLHRIHWGPRLGYAYLLGVAWVAGGLYAGSHLFDLPLNRTSILTLAALPFLAGLGRFVFSLGAPALPGKKLSRRYPLSVTLAVIVGTAVTLGLFAEALTEPLADWDGRMTWASQARYLRAVGTVDAPALRKDRWFITHPRYPVLLPVAQVAALELADAGEDEEPFRLLYAAFFPAFLLVLADGARRAAGRRAAGWTVLAAAAPPFLAAREGGAAGAYSDLALGCFYGAALVLLGRSRPRWGEGIAAGLLLAAAALSKNEGALLAGFALAAAAWITLRGLRPGRPDRVGARLAPVAIAAIFALAALLLFFSWRAPIPNRHDEGYEKFATGALWPAAVTRIPLLAPVVLARFASWERWVLFWWVAPVVLYAGRRGFRRRSAPPLLLAFLAPLAIGWGAYSIHWSPIYLATVTWDRLLIQGAIPLFLLFAMALSGLAVERG